MHSVLPGVLKATEYVKILYRSSSPTHKLAMKGSIISTGLERNFVDVSTFVYTSSEPIYPVNVGASCRKFLIQRFLHHLYDSATTFLGHITLVRMTVNILNNINPAYWAPNAYCRREEKSCQAPPKFSLAVVSGSPKASISKKHAISNNLVYLEPPGQKVTYFIRSINYFDWLSDFSADLNYHDVCALL